MLDRSLHKQHPSMDRIHVSNQTRHDPPLAASASVQGGQGQADATWQKVPIAWQPGPTHPGLENGGRAADLSPKRFSGHRSRRKSFRTATQSSMRKNQWLSCRFDWQCISSPRSITDHMWPSARETETERERERGRERERDREREREKERVKERESERKRERAWLHIQASSNPSIRAKAITQLPIARPTPATRHRREGSSRCRTPRACYSPQTAVWTAALKGVTPAKPVPKLPIQHASVNLLTCVGLNLLTDIPHVTLGIAPSHWQDGAKVMVKGRTRPETFFAGSQKASCESDGIETKQPCQHCAFMLLV